MRKNLLFIPVILCVSASAAFVLRPDLLPVVWEYIGLAFAFWGLCGLSCIVAAFISKDTAEKIGMFAANLKDYGLFYVVIPIGAASLIAKGLQKLLGLR